MFVYKTVLCCTSFKKDPYHDFRHLEVAGALLNPQAVITKAPKAELTFLPDVDLNKPNRMEFTAEAVGSLRVNDGVLHGLLSIPLDVLSPVLHGLSLMVH